MRDCLIIIAAFCINLTWAAGPFPRNLEDFSSNIGNSIVPAIFPSANPNGNGTTYSYSSWSAYSGCDKICGGGVNSRYRKCFSNTGQEVSMTFCSLRGLTADDSFEVLQFLLSGKNLVNETQTFSCNQQLCNIGSWEQWSACSYPCGGGQQYSFRMCLDGPNEECNFQSKRSRMCNTDHCYIMDQWEAWGNCSKTCNVGKRYRNRQCVPFLRKSDPQYTFIEKLMETFGKLEFQINVASLLSTYESLAHYYYQFKKTCVRSTQREANHCNVFPCPECDQNQIYHECKPCVQNCKASTGLSASLYNLKRDIEKRIINSIQGCDDECVPGCGCPILTPYLASNGRCYPVQAQCPSGAYSRILTSYRIPVFGKSVFQSTQISPGHHSTEHTPPGTSTPSTTTTTTTVSTTLPAPCPYNTAITTTPGKSLPCHCDGILQSDPCYLSPGTSCPVRCLDDSANQG